MLNLKSTDTLKLDISTDGDIVTVVHYVESDATIGGASDMVPDRVVARWTTLGLKTLLAGAATKVRNVKAIEIINVSSTVSNTLKPILDVSGTPFEIRPATTILARECWNRSDLGIWHRYDVNSSMYSVGGAVVDPARNDFRLTGVSGTPVMTADSTTLSNLFLAQYVGNHISLYDGVNWQDVIPAVEPTLAVTGRTTDLPFDVFVYLLAGVPTLELLNWTSATARATALARLDGVLVKSGDPTRRYLGSVRARSATTYHWVTQGLDLPVKLDLFNYDNRVEVAFMLRAGTNTWAYTLATWRQAQASANYQVDIMNGWQDQYFAADLLVSSRNSTISIPRQVGIGFDSTTAFTGVTSATANTVASIECDQNAGISHMPTVGRHFYAWLEISTATGTCTWIGDDGALRLQSGMRGLWKC